MRQRVGRYLFADLACVGCIEIYTGVEPEFGYPITGRIRVLFHEIEDDAPNIGKLTCHGRVLLKPPLRKLFVS